jgi:hypothetical protein
MRGLLVQAPQGGQPVVDDLRYARIVAVVVVLAASLTIFFLQVAQPTGRIVEFLFPKT